jgi:hypothetical protein
VNPARLPSNRLTVEWGPNGSSRQVLRIRLSGAVNARVLSNLTEVFTSNTSLCQCDLELDMSAISHCQFGGAIAILCVVAAWRNAPSESLVDFNQLYFIEPRSPVNEFLASIGFYSVLFRMVPTHEIEQLRGREPAYRKPSSAFGGGYLPLKLKLIPQRSAEFSTYRFEDIAADYINQLIENLFVAVRKCALTEKGVHDFLNANFELLNNIYEHSDAVGIVGTYYSQRLGILGCYYDIGQGFAASVNKALGLNFDSAQAIAWSVKRGHSRKNDQKGGEGLAIVEDFVSANSGLIEIRTGNALLQSDHRKAKRALGEVPFFPGAQISMFIPVNHSEGR